MAGEAVTAMIVAADAGDNPLADRREDREAAAERERKAKVAKLNSQTANAMKVVRAQQAAKERGAFDEAALRANEVAGAPVKASSTWSRASSIRDAGAKIGRWCSGASSERLRPARELQLKFVLTT